MIECLLFYFCIKDASFVSNDNNIYDKIHASEINRENLVYTEYICWFQIHNISQWDILWHKNISVCKIKKIYFSCLVYSLGNAFWQPGWVFILNTLINTCTTNHLSSVFCEKYMAFLILLTSTGSTWISTVVHLLVGSWPLAGLLQWAMVMVNSWSYNPSTDRDGILWPLHWLDPVTPPLTVTDHYCGGPTPIFDHFFI